jgi:hypothetical protein
MVALFSVTVFTAVTAAFICVVGCQLMLRTAAKMAKEMLHLAVTTSL